MKIRLFILIIITGIIGSPLKAYYFNNHFLDKYSIQKPYFEGKFEAGGDKQAIQKIGTYISHLISGDISLDDLNTPLIQLYYYISFLDNLYGGSFYSFTRGTSKIYNDDITLKLKKSIYQLDFYQHNKIYKNIYAGLIANIFYEEYKFKEDKSLVKELLEDEYTEENKLVGLDISGGLNYSFYNFVVLLQLGPELKFFTFKNSNGVEEKYNVTLGTFLVKLKYNFAFTIFLQPVYIDIFTFYKKNYFEESYGGGFNWKINKYFNFITEGSNNRYVSIFSITPFSFFSFDMRLEYSKIKYKTDYKYVIDEKNISFFAGITLKFKSLGIPSFRN